MENDIFYPGNFVINNEEEIVKITGLHFNNSLFEGKFIKSKYITRLLITNALFVKSSFKQYKSPDMELKVTKDKVLEAASKCSTAKETLKTLFPEAFIETGFEKLNMDGLQPIFYHSMKVIRDKGYIKVPLPNANHEWSVAAFEWVIKFCKQNEGTYIYHDPKLPYNFIHIKLSYFK